MTRGDERGSEPWLAKIMSNLWTSYSWFCTFYQVNDGKARGGQLTMHRHITLSSSKSLLQKYLLLEQRMPLTLLRKPIELMEKNIFSRYNANISRNNANISRNNANVSRNNANVSRNNANISRNNANVSRYNITRIYLRNKTRINSRLALQ